MEFVDLPECRSGAMILDFGRLLWLPKLSITKKEKKKVYRENGTRLAAYVPDIYWRETYRRTYQSNFYLVGHEDFWRDAPYNLTFYPSNMNNQQGRKQGTRFRVEMDYQNPDSFPRCSRYRMPRPNRKKL
ncbi:hypothetical protein M9H77_16345 [Catharanthus roseus]|uniref:Uncharacterized protein n=1 Tax=Catharanthus roseus TaxID=4058 RepID=A0ACC0B1H7_CATRO|nr:hypothetical protein M9H77_16345 [Catharanthus roseus]